MIIIYGIILANEQHSKGKLFTHSSSQCICSHFHKIIGKSNYFISISFFFSHSQTLPSKIENFSKSNFNVLIMDWVFDWNRLCDDIQACKRCVTKCDIFVNSFFQKHNRFHIRTYARTNNSTTDSIDSFPWTNSWHCNETYILYTHYNIRQKRNNENQSTYKYSGRMKGIGVTSVYPEQKSKKTCVSVRLTACAKETGRQAVTIFHPVSCKDSNAPHCGACALVYNPNLICGWWILYTNSPVNSCAWPPLLYNVWR